MKYRELLELYKKGQLDEKTKEMIENDIEKQDSISDYLFENSTIPGQEKFMNMEEDNMVQSDYSEKMKDEVDEFPKMIKHSIRRAFVKAGIITGGIILAIVMFVMFALPRIIDSIYYNPTELVKEKAEGAVETERLSLDFATYSELFLPGKYRCKTISTGRGYGCYDINIIQTYSFNGIFRNVAGKIEKNNIIFYDSNSLSFPTGNALDCNVAGVDDDYEGYGAAGDWDNAKKSLNDLDDSKIYTAYVTFDTVLNYNEFVNWCTENDERPDWMALCQQKKSEDGKYQYAANNIIGCMYSGCASALNYDEKEYPYLTAFSTDTTTSDEKDWIVSEEVMRMHASSLMRYLSDQKEFCEMMGIDTEELSEMEKNISSNGLNIYGYVICADKEEILNMVDKEHIGYIYVTTEL